MNSITPMRRQLITIVVMAATVLVVLDSTIANVALPQMQATLSANPESVAWILTSYILATAVAMPLTGYLSNRFGRRVLFSISVLGFTLSSALCGFSTSLPMMVAARFTQGLFGAFLSPMSQAIMYDINPPERHAHAMMIWGMVIMVGPIMGPVLGGWLTENFDWRWVFFVNVPIGIPTAIFAWTLLGSDERQPRKFDVLGFALLALMLSSMQLLLDRGSQQDWFESTEIWIELAIMLSTLWMFVIHTIITRDPLMPRALFLDRNFVTSIMAGTVIGGILIAGAALVSPMLQQLFGYPVLEAGFLTVPRGIGTVVSMLVAGQLSGKIDSRILIGTGLTLIAISLWMMTGFSLDMDQGPIIWSGAVQGLGFGLVVMPMNLLAMTTLGARLRTEAASLYNLARSIGGSVAISIMTALIASNTQTSHADLGTHVSNTRAALLSSGLLEQMGVSAGSVMGMVNAEINRQALMIAYLDDYWLMMWSAIAVIPLIIVMRPQKSGGMGMAMDAH